MQNNQNIQTIYIYMDDSGKLSYSDKCCSYGGIYFTNVKDRDNFKRLYYDVIKTNKCHFCSDDKNSCSKSCPEIKSHTTDTKFRRRIVNMIKNSPFAHSYATTIYTRNIPKSVLDVKHSRGRRTDYYQKMIIKEIVKKLIDEKTIDPNKPLKLFIRIDESPRATNGIYKLDESIIEELQYGIVNYNYGCTFPPILHNKLIVDLQYVNSKKEYLVQASDFFAGYVNATLLYKPEKTNLDIVDVQLFF